MKNEKEYYNIKLEKILKLYITKEKYGDFALIIEDIFQRRAYEFDFPLEQMIDEVTKFDKNVNSIKFVPKEEMGSETYMGAYWSRTSEIKLNQDYFNKLLRKSNDYDFGEKLYETLAHEVFHAIADRCKENKGNGNGLTYYNYIVQKWKGTALNEICTETAADRISISRNVQDSMRFRTETNGYRNITFVTNLLAASMGVTEKQFLAAGVQKRGKVMELFYSKFPQQDMADFAQKNIFDVIETNLDIIYNINYENDSNINEEDKKKDLMVSALTNLYNKCFELASFQIATDTQKSLKECSADTIYRMQKMERIMRDSLNDFLKYGIISKKDIKKINFDTYPIRERVATKVNAISNLESERYKIQDSKVLQKQFELAKQGIFYEKSNIEMLQNVYGFELKYKKVEDIRDITQDLEYTSYVLREDFDNGLQWDNSSSSIVMKKIFDEHMKSIEKGFFSRIKNGFKNIIAKFKNRNLQQLSGTSQIVGDEVINNANKNLRNKNDYFSQYIVDPNSIKHEEVKLNEEENNRNIDEQSNGIDY